MCLACGSTRKSKEISAREMMFATHVEFLYHECADCRSLQISEIPNVETLARHYPENYYSLRKIGATDEAVFTAPPVISLRDRMKKWRDQHALGVNHPIGAILEIFRPALGATRYLAAIKIRRLTDRILDVGCGANTEILEKLAGVGFKNLLGCDPFISADVSILAGVKILKRTAREIEGKFDIVMFHHSFEHLPDPRETLIAVKKLLSSGGICLIRMPTPSSDAYETYGPNWVQLDPPRHLILPSRSGMKILANECGFLLERVVDDSSRFQFTASELYLRDVPLQEQHDGFFSNEALKAYDRQSEVLNATHRGDQAAFVLRAY